MRRLHPLWRGLWLALSLTVILTLLGSTDVLSPYRLERKPMALYAAVAAGSFFASLPGRLRQRAARRTNPPRFPWKRCLLSFCCGLAMPLGLGMAGDGRILFALMQGSAGAFAFLGMAWTAGFVTVQVMEGRKRA